VSGRRRRRRRRRVGLTPKDLGPQVMFSAQSSFIWGETVKMSKLHDQSTKTDEQ